jgi:hypothetical protein
VVGVDAFRETKRIEHIKDSGEIRQQILDQLKTAMLSSDAQDIDADSLLVKFPEIRTLPRRHPEMCDGTPPSHIHTIPTNLPRNIGNPPPYLSNRNTPRGDIFGEIRDVIKWLSGNIARYPLDNILGVI